MSIIRKSIFFLLLFFIGAACFAQEPAPQGQDSGPDPIQAMVQEAFAANKQILAKHKDAQKYFNDFLPLWEGLFKQLRDAQDKSTGLEEQFQNYYDALQKEIPLFKKLKPPSDFKDFNDAIGKGLDDLSDWVMDMQDRVHYSTTDYQREAYMKKLDDFQKNWYENYFGPGLEELSGSWAIYSTYYWQDNLTPAQLQNLRQNATVDHYLLAYHGIMAEHLKAAAKLARKARKAKEEEEDEQKSLDDIKDEAPELQGTVKRLQKLNPPAEFKNFQELEIQWLKLMEKGTQQYVQIETAMRKNAPDDKIQEMINKRNEIDLQSRGMQQKIADAYDNAMSAVLHSLRSSGSGATSTQSVPSDPKN